MCEPERKPVTNPIGYETKARELLERYYRGLRGLCARKNVVRDDDASQAQTKLSARHRGFSYVPPRNWEFESHRCLGEPHTYITSFRPHHDKNTRIRLYCGLEHQFEILQLLDEVPLSRSNDLSHSLPVDLQNIKELVLRGGLLLYDSERSRPPRNQVSIKITDIYQTVSEYGNIFCVEGAYFTLRLGQMQRYFKCAYFVGCGSNTLDEVSYQAPPSVFPVYLPDFNRTLNTRKS